MFILVFMFFLSPRFTFCYEELIKLESKTHLICVTDAQESIVYVVPPVLEPAKNTSILIENDRIWNDWELKQSTDVIVPQALDQRWDDFETSYTNYIYLNSVASLSFSVYGTGCNITTSDVKTISKQLKSVPKDWLHIMLYPISETPINIQINATTTNDTYWKIHDYKLRWAEQVLDIDTVISVSSEQASSCLILYVYQCSYCNLEVTVNSQRTYNFSGNERATDDIQPWTKQTISLESNNTIKFVRRTNNKQTNGQWAIDIRKCPELRLNKTIYEVSLENDVQPANGRKCETATGTLLQSDDDKKDIFSCKPGRLGKKCDVSCEDLLGSEMKFCEKHKICDNLVSETCFCAWGYEGDLCDQTCSKGKCGLSCQDTCSGESSKFAYFTQGIAMLVLGVFSYLLK